MAFSEMWLKDDITGLYPFSRYNAFHSCRKNKAGGGLSIYLLDKYNCIQKKDISQQLDKIAVESVFVEIPSCPQFGGKNIIIGFIYRPPDSDTDTFIDALCLTLEMITKEHKMCFLFGDFNINPLKSNSSFSSDFLNVVFSTHFYSLIHKPTRITSTSATLIDNIMVNCLDYKMASGILLADISDHLPVFQIVYTKPNKISKSNSSDHKGTKYHKYTKRNMEAFKCSID